MTTERELASGPTAELKIAAAETQQALLGRLAVTRGTLGLSQAELANRVGLSRMTVQRCEAEGADTNFSTFVVLALALNLTPELLASNAAGHVPKSENIVHRGTAHNRTRYDLDFRDRQRERALARAWEAANRHDDGFAPILQTLVPNHSQEQATAAATVVQWLGSEVGFAFLMQALKKAGYAVIDTKNEPS